MIISSYRCIADVICLWSLEMVWTLSKASCNMGLSLSSSANRCSMETNPLTLSESKVYLSTPILSSSSCFIRDNEEFIALCSAIFSVERFSKNILVLFILSFIVFVDSVKSFLEILSFSKKSFYLFNFSNVASKSSYGTNNFILLLIKLICFLTSI